MVGPSSPGTLPAMDWDTSFVGAFQLNSCELTAFLFLTVGGEGEGGAGAWASEGVWNSSKRRAETGWLHPGRRKETQV